MSPISDAQVNEDLQTVCQDRHSADRFVARIIQTALPMALRSAAKLHPNALQRAAMEATAELCARDATRDGAIAVAEVAQRSEESATGIDFRYSGLLVSRLAFAAVQGNVRNIVVRAFVSECCGDDVKLAIAEALRETASEAESITLMAA